jgi:hypothetical protein
MRRRALLPAERSPVSVKGALERPPNCLPRHWKPSVRRRWIRSQRESACSMKASLPTPGLRDERPCLQPDMTSRSHRLRPSVSRTPAHTPERFRGVQGGSDACPANIVVSTSRRVSVVLSPSSPQEDPDRNKGTRPIGMLGALRGCAGVGHHSPGIRHSPIMTVCKPNSATGIPCGGIQPSWAATPSVTDTSHLPVSPPRRELR